MVIYKEANKKNIIDSEKSSFIRRALNDFIKKNDNKYPNLAVLSRDEIGMTIQIHGLYEKEELEFFIGWLNYNKFIFNGAALDVGANIGNHSVFFSKYFEQVISFEPNPNVYHLLKYNSTLGGNITTYNVGISESYQETFLNIVDGNVGASYVDNNGNTPIKLVNLDTFLDYSELISLIKIDVEGHELLALKGMKNIIKNNKPLILFEQWESEFKNNKNQVMEYLNSLGYEKFVYIDNNRPSGFLSKLIRIYKRISGSLERRMIVKRKNDILPNFYPFIIAIHKKNEHKFNIK